MAHQSNAVNYPKYYTYCHLHLRPFRQRTMLFDLEDVRLRMSLTVHTLEDIIMRVY